MPQGFYGGSHYAQTGGDPPCPTGRAMAMCSPQEITLVRAAPGRDTRAAELRHTARAAGWYSTICAPSVARGDTPHGARHPDLRPTGADQGNPGHPWPP